MFKITNAFTIEKNPEKYKYSQSEIIYLVSSVEKVEKNKLKYIFSDGHAYVEFTKFYNQISELNYLDWEAIESKKWFILYQIRDRRRRKQAEFLVYQNVPFDCLEGIVTFNQTTLNHVQMVLSNHNKELYNDIRPNWYY